MEKYILILAIVALPQLVVGQSPSLDSLLLNERSIDRPVTVHAGQIRVTGGYDVFFISRTFDENSKAVDLVNEDPSTRHRIELDVKYGITEYIQFNAATRYTSHIVRDASQDMLPGVEMITQNIFHEYQGLEDIYTGVDLRAPFRTRKFDIALSLGATLPVARSDPKQPQHSVEGGNSTRYFEYRYHHAPGIGVVVARLGGIAKYRTEKWAFSARLDYQHGLKDASTYEWRHQLTDDTFEYRKYPISYRIPDSNTYYIEGEFQPTRRVDVFVRVSGYTAFDGWRTTQNGIKVATPYQTMTNVSPGVEIIATPKLWIRGMSTFALAGKNIYAPFSFQAMVMYNLDARNWVSGGR